VQALRISIPVGEGFVAGDVVNVTVNGVKLNREPIPLFAGQTPYAGLYQGRQFDRPQFGAPPAPGNLGGTQFGGRAYAPGRTIVLDTMPLYYGLKVVGVMTADYLGNEGVLVEQECFVDTGPHAPRNLRSTSPAAAVPTFTFTPSAELSV
jgi:hypothetical protein